MRRRESPSKPERSKAAADSTYIGIGQRSGAGGSSITTVTIMATSGEGYSPRRNAEKGMQSVIKMQPRLNP
jgi:hypothetical protein